MPKDYFWAIDSKAGWWQENIIYPAKLALAFRDIPGTDCGYNIASG